MEIKNVQVVKPFGPLILVAQLPEGFIKKLNDIVDVIKDKKDMGSRLAGVIETESEIPHSMLEEKKCMDVFPSRKVKHDWTVEGIQYTEHCKNSNTNGINSGFNKRRIVANFNPTIATLPSDNLGLRGGLFNLGGIMPGFPTTGGSSSRLNPGPSTS